MSFSSKSTMLYWRIFALIILAITVSLAVKAGSNRQTTDLLTTFRERKSDVKKYVLVLSKGSQSVLVLDYKTLDSITSIPVGADPHEIITNPSGTLAYVSRPEMNDNGHHIAVLDLKHLTLNSTIDTRPFYLPHGLAFLKGQLWFTAQGSKAVAVYDILKQKVVQVFGTGQNFTHLIYISDDGKAFYTTNVESGTVSIYTFEDLPPYMPPTGVLPRGARPRHQWRQTLVPVNMGAEGFDVSKDGKELWTASPDGFLIVLDLEKKQVKTKINTHVLGLHRLKITPDGQTVCVVSVKTGDLLYYNRQTLKLEEKVHIGQGAGIYMDKNSNRMYVSCTPDNCVDVIDLNTRKEIRKIYTGRPDGITSVEVQN